MANRVEWSRSRVVRKYAKRRELLVPERVWLERHTEALRGARILDLGVGCGRTSPHLLRLSTDYVGVDYSARMIACAKRRLPGVDFRVGDARALDFPDGRFELVVFSFNGIDMVDRDDRFRVLREVYRVLVPGGTFFFSSHNLDHPPAPARVRPTANPVKLAWRVGLFLAGAANHRRRRRAEVQGEGWAILNDKANEYRLLTHYVLPRVQEAELAAIGFVLSEALDEDGAHVDVTQPSASKLIYYAARRG